MRKNYKLIILVILLVIVDQFIKYIVINNISNGSDIVVISNFLKFTFLTNTGGALGILSGNILMLTLISIMLIWYIVKEINKEKNIFSFLILAIVCFICFS
jgi:signal peptidase II